MSPVLLMPNPLHKLLDKKAVARLPGRVRWTLTGLARDFWKNGPENPFKRSRGATAKPVPAAARAREPTEAAGWHAMPGEISERMWGDGFVAPGGDVMLDMLIKPLGLDKQSSVLDLSAGLGAFLRKAASSFESSVTSLESDPAVAIRANELLMRTSKGKTDVISYYTPDGFIPDKTVNKLYDCIVARELFYRVKDKDKFFAALAACTKPQAQLSFTDYILNAEDQDKPAITAWVAHEGNASPLGLVTMAEAWAKAGFKLRVHDDQTALYRQEVLAGLRRFSQYLAAGPRPDGETKETILRRLEGWTHRLAALEHGVKLYRFYGTK